MTVRINFLPRSYQPPQELGPKGWAMAAAAAVALVSVGVFYVGAYASANRMEAQALVSQAELQDVKVRLALAAEIRTHEEQVARSRAELESLTGRHWSSVLLTLRDMTPQHVMWTNVSIAGDQVTLRATCKGLVDVAQLFGGLVDLHGVDEVTLKYAAEKGTEFTVSAKGNDQNAKQEATQALGGPRQMDFEMVITLLPAEGRRLPNGA